MAGPDNSGLVVFMPAVLGGTAAVFAAVANAGRIMTSVRLPTPLNGKPTCRNCTRSMSVFPTRFRSGLVWYVHFVPNSACDSAVYTGPSSVRTDVNATTSSQCCRPKSTSANIRTAPRKRAWFATYLTRATVM